MWSCFATTSCQKHLLSGRRVVSFFHEIFSVFTTVHVAVMLMLSCGKTAQYLHKCHCFNVHRIRSRISCTFCHIRVSLNLFVNKFVPHIFPWRFSFLLWSTNKEACCCGCWNCFLCFWISTIGQRCVSVSVVVWSVMSLIYTWRHLSGLFHDLTPHIPPNVPRGQSILSVYDSSLSWTFSVGSPVEQAVWGHKGGERGVGHDRWTNQWKCKW